MSRFIELDQVEKVYSGKDGKCCCGCAGSHRSKLENFRAVKMLVKRMNRAISDGASVDVGAGYKAVTIGDRLYVAYSTENS